ncbi:MAG: hypothetical protein MJ183_06175 [Treponemataceae bacterium]|nr:hypothetical protein [Treponemataceae bacterium]
MKRNTLFGMIILVVTLLFFVSCDMAGMFTVPLAESFKRDTEKVFEKADAGDIVAAATDTKVANSPEAAAGLLSALGNKDVKEVVDLEPEQKTAVLNLAASVVIPTSSIGGALDNLKDLASEEYNNKSPEEKADAITGIITSTLTSIIDNAIEIKNTDAITALLKSHNESTDPLSNEEENAVMMASVALTVNAVKKSGIDFEQVSENITKVFKDDDVLDLDENATDEEKQEALLTLVDSILGTGVMDPELKNDVTSDLTIAVETIINLSEKGVSLLGLFGGFGGSGN